MVTTEATEIRATVTEIRATVAEIRATVGSKMKTAASFNMFGSRDEGDNLFFLFATRDRRKDASATSMLLSYHVSSAGHITKR